MSGGGPSGVLVVDKASGVTSFDVVAMVRRQLRVRRIGHAGTLDPTATGVLPILIGEATKLMPYLVDQDKEYLASLRFGVTTDTGDLSGRVLSTSSVAPADRAALEAACRQFVGRIQQVPPMYSAIHHEGRRLYELAREGVEVDRAPREVVISSITVVEASGAEATLRVTCGKGTYLRALADDLGRLLGGGAAVERLARLRVGPFELSEAVSWGEVTGGGEALWSRVRPAEAALAGWPAVGLEAKAVVGFRNGQTVPVVAGPGDGGRVRVHDRLGTFLGVGELSAGGRSVRPVRILHADRPGTRVLPV